MGVFSKTNVMIIFFAVVLAKIADFFAHFFGENIFKNHNNGPSVANAATSDFTTTTPEV
jgi:CDP-diglyceride synthetase